MTAGRGRTVVSHVACLFKFGGFEVQSRGAWDGGVVEWRDRKGGSLCPTRMAEAGGEIIEDRWVREEIEVAAEN